MRETTPSSQDVIVREAREDDLGQVGDLRVELLDYHHLLDDRFWRRAPEGRKKFLEWVEKALNAEERILLVADSAGRIVGFVHGMLRQSPPPVVSVFGGFVTDLVVAESHRRTGVGRGLMAGAEQWFRERGAEQVTRVTDVRNPDAIAFWERMGFEPWTYTMWEPLGE